MSLNKQDVWADLKYALDELERPSLDDTHDLLGYVGNLDEQPKKEFLDRLFLTNAPALAYSRAKARADTRNAHEAIEKGLKAILLDGGLSKKQVRSHSHELHRLLASVQQHNPTAFNELDRCFNSVIQYLESVTTLQHDTNIVDYFRKHGKAKVFVASRYASIDGGNNTDRGMIGRVYREIIRALLSIAFGWTPKDICSRIEEEARKAILAENRLDPTWDAAEWLTQEPVRPRLEDIENLKNDKVLRAAVRRCARESRDSGIKHWADSLRRDLIIARRKERSDHRVG